MNHVDLFSGIGGFALAARNTWGEEYNNVCFCEINKYAQAVLRKNFGKDVVICEDIRTLKAEQFGVVTNADRCGRVHWKSKIKSAKGSHEAQREPIASIESPGVHASDTRNSVGRAKQREQQKERPEVHDGGNGLRIDLLTGGFPCQPFSQAGQRRGTEDDRFLWPEMLRVISEFRPTWIIGENVAGLLSMAEFDGESEVASETDLFGNRIDTHTKRGRGILFRIIGELEQIGYSVQTFVIPACAVNAPHRRDRVWIVAHTNAGREHGERTTGTDEKCERPAGRRFAPEQWNENWLEVATRFCRVDDGLPERLYFLNGLGYTPSKGDDYEESDDTETEPKICESVWKEMRKVWSEWLSKQAPCQDAEEGDNDSLRPVPCKGTPKEWDAPSEEAEELRGMWQRFYAAPFQEAQDLFPELLERIREIERKKKVGCSLNLSKAGHRVERFKALGNAIVPQVAEQFMRAIKSTEEQQKRRSK
jgi:DNA (cytosine-5)-methyltransferase 1